MMNNPPLQNSSPAGYTTPGKEAERLEETADGKRGDEWA
jgi:hypothetical protein